MMSDTEKNHDLSPQSTLMTSHGLVLLYAAANPSMTIRRMSDDLALTERRIIDIIHDLAAANLLRISRNGRRNQYRLNPEAHFSDPMLASVPFQAFVNLWRSWNNNLQQDEMP